jgi:hypothetical protein
MNREETAAQLRRCEELIEKQRAFTSVCNATSFFRYRKHGDPESGLSFAGARIWVPALLPPENFPHSTYLPLESFPQKSTSDRASVQWLGFHKNLVLTFRRPLSHDSLLRISEDVPSIEPFGRVVWLGQCRLARTRGGIRQSRRGWCYQIPLSSWTPPEPHFHHEPTQLWGLAHWYPIPSGDHELMLFEFPAVTREMFDVCMI